MLAAGKMAGKIIFVCALVTADVALEWMFVAVAAHVNGVENIVRKVNITMLAFMQDLLVRYGQGGGGCARLAVVDTCSQTIHAVLKAKAGSRATILMA